MVHIVHCFSQNNLSGPRSKQDLIGQVPRTSKIIGQVPKFHPISPQGPRSENADRGLHEYALNGNPSSLTVDTEIILSPSLTPFSFKQEAMEEEPY